MAKEGALVKAETQELDAYSPEFMVQQVGLIQKMMASVMKEDEHYGVIPGTAGKPTLLKAGAEKLGFTFKLAPRVTEQIVVDIQPISGVFGHREYRLKLELVHRQTGAFMGEGVGSCSTLEGKYRFRDTKRLCPKCKKNAIIKGKEEYGGGWVCFKKKDGCGAKFADGDTAIEGQPPGKVEHTNPPDYWNTCLKMAYKRALVSATLVATAASDIFTQDIEDMGEVIPQPTPQTTPAQPVTAPPQPSEGSSEGEAPQATEPPPPVPVTEGEISPAFALYNKLAIHCGCDKTCMQQTLGDVTAFKASGKDKYMTLGEPPVGSDATWIFKASKKWLISAAGKVDKLTDSRNMPADCVQGGGNCFYANYDGSGNCFCGDLEVYCPFSPQESVA